MVDSWKLHLKGESYFNDVVKGFSLQTRSVSWEAWMDESAGKEGEVLLRHV